MSAAAPLHGRYSSEIKRDARGEPGDAAAQAAARPAGGGSHAVLYPQTSTPSEECPQHSLLPPQIGDRLQCTMLGELLCVQHGKGWLCRWDLPVLVGSLLGSVPPIMGGTHGHRGARYGQVPPWAQSPVAWGSQPRVLCGEASVGSGALPVPRAGGAMNRAKPSLGQQQTHSRSAGQDGLPGLAIQGHLQRQPG